MKTVSTNSCSNVKRGNLISQYELGLIDDEDRAAFEEHLFECAFCREELEHFRPAARVLMENREGLIEELKRQELKQAASRVIPVPRLSAAGFLKRLQRTLDDVADSILKPRILAPIISAAAVIALIIIGVQLRENTPYKEFVVFEPLPYKKMVLMGEQSDKAEILFRNAMAGYSAGNFKDAVKCLSEAVKLDTANFRYKTYLGVSYFMLNKPRKALKALTEAERMTRYIQKDELHWFIFQSFLLSGDLAQADSVRHIMAGSRESFSTSADSVWNVLNSRIKH